MLDGYTGAFTRYLRTGTVGALSEFCAEDADLSRLRVYRNGFLRACIEALRASYPSVERLVGEERFPALARPYVEAHPPRTASLVEYGEDFPRFVENARDMHGLDYLASFAALDRAWSDVYFAEDADVAARPAEAAAALTGGTSSDAGACSNPGGKRASGVQPAADTDGPGATGPAGGIPGDADALMSLRGRLAPWVRMVSLDYCVLHAWSRLRQGELGQRMEVRHAPQQALIRRGDAEVLYRDLACPEHTFIACIAAGRPCGEAAVAALEIDAGFDLVATFASLLHHHVLTFEH